MQEWGEDEKAQLHETLKMDLTEEEKQTLSIAMDAFVAIAEK